MIRKNGSVSKGTLVRRFVSETGNPSFPRKNVTPAASKQGQPSMTGFGTAPEPLKSALGSRPGLLSAGVTFFRGNDVGRWPSRVTPQGRLGVVGATKLAGFMLAT